MLGGGIWKKHGKLCSFCIQVKVTQQCTVPTHRVTAVGEGRLGGPGGVGGSQNSAL